MREDGFTLIELLITVLILPVVMGAIAVGLVAVLSIQGSASNRLTDSGGAQVTSANFVQDVQSAALVTIDAAAPQCGPGTQRLGLQWTSGGATVVVTYAEVAEGKNWLLVRQFCSNGFSTTPSASRPVSFDIQAGLAPPTLQTTAASLLAAQQGWISVQPVTEVIFPVVEPPE